jgi:AcrR family transcriptional regulator
MRRAKQPRGMATKASILEGAKEVIAKKGFSAITLDDLLAAAGNISKGKFFHHFKSKDDLFRELLVSAMDERKFLCFDSLLQKCASPSPFDRLMFVMDKVIEWHEEGLPDAMRLCVFATVFFSGSSPEMKRIAERLSKNSAIIEKLIKSCIAEKELPKALNPKLLSLLIPSAAVGGNTVGFLSHERNLTVENLRQLKSMVLLLRTPYPTQQAHKTSRREKSL